VEGEGSFFVRRAKNYPAAFSISLTESESAVLEMISKFLLELSGKLKTDRENSKFVGIFRDIARRNTKPMVNLTVGNIDFNYSKSVEENFAMQLDFRTVFYKSNCPGVLNTPGHCNVIKLRRNPSKIIINIHN